jgi:SAM-dependent methyltransferase
MPGEWADTAEAYAGSFARLCAGSVGAVLDAAAHRSPPPGSLLDVGTGTGTLARAAAARGWQVEACDPEPDMLAVAASAGGGGVRYRVGALPELPYPSDSVDAACANFVVNHTHRPREALADLARVARRLVAVTIWPRRRTVLNGIWAGIVADAGAVTPPGTAVPPEHDIERSDEGLRAALESVGLGEVETTALEWDFAIAPGDLWAGVAAGAGTIGTVYRAQDDAVRRRLGDAYRVRTAELTARDGLLHLPTFALLGIGTPTVGAAGSG